MATVPAKKLGMRIEPKKLPMLVACAPTQSRKGAGATARTGGDTSAPMKTPTPSAPMKTPTCVKGEEEAIEAWCVHVEHYRSTVAVASLLLFAVMITLANRRRNVWDEKKVDCGLE